MIDWENDRAIRRSAGRRLDPPIQLCEYCHQPVDECECDFCGRCGSRMDECYCEEVRDQ